MKYHFFHILAIDAKAETERLNQLLKEQAIQSIERQFVSDGINSFWSICVITLKQESLTQNNRGGRSKVDYQQVLNPQHFSIFSRLRSIRNQMATEQSIPPYAVFTNEQLSQISPLEPISYDAISTIKGIGGKRLKDYTVTLLKIYSHALSNGDNHA